MLKFENFIRYFFVFSSPCADGFPRLKKEIKFKWCPTRVIIFLFRLFYGCVYYIVCGCVCVCVCASVYLPACMCAYKTGNKKTKMNNRRKETKQEDKTRRETGGRRRGSQNFFSFIIWERERKKKKKKKKMSNKWLIYLLMAKSLVQQLQ